MMILYHVTTPKKARLYRASGCIKSPVRGFDTFMAALAWAVKTRRTVIYECNAEHQHLLPDHHNKFGLAFWNNGDITEFSCVFSAESDA